MEDRTIVEWDKDDLESLGMLKIDVLALGMLTCIRKAFSLLDAHYGRRETLASLPDGDTPTYDMICRADTIGVFQIESRAQMSMLPRLRPRCYYDLVIEVAIVRPGPIQGDMVHPYLRRRQGKEPVSFPKKELEAVLGKTLGVPLFQEQAMNIAIVAGGFSPGEADKLRRAMATFRRVGTIGSFQKKMVEGMVRNGYERDFAEHCFRQIEGFGEYGFPESHAASFALLVYVSCWLKCHYPDVFCAAILNSQPMGFYAPAQLDPRRPRAWRRDQPRRHQFFRLGRHAGTGCRAAAAVGRHREMAGCHEAQPCGAAGAAARQGVRRGGCGNAGGQGAAAAMTACAICGCARACRAGRSSNSPRPIASAPSGLTGVMRCGRSRRSIRSRAPSGCRCSPQPTPSNLQSEPDIDLPPMPLGEQVINDYQSLSFSLKAHPMSFLRERLAGSGFRPNVDLEGIRSGSQWSRSRGWCWSGSGRGRPRAWCSKPSRTRPASPTSSSGPRCSRSSAIVLGSRCVGVRGRLQNEDGVIHVVAD
jgi:hypothetical protein